MKKILFILQCYPSQRSANVMCDERVIDELKKSDNVEIHCMASQYDGQPEYEVIDGVHVHRWNKGLCWKLYSWALQNEKDARAKLVFKIQRVVMRIKQLIMIPFFPITEPFVCRMCAKAAERIYNEIGFDVVLAEHYGTETVLAGCALKKKHNEVRFIPVFWDALSGAVGVRYLPAKYVNRKRTKLEERILRTADLAIALKSHEQHLKDLWKDSSIIEKVRFLDIPRFDPDVSKKHHPLPEDFDSSKVNIVYAGNLGLRDPEYIFELLSQTEQEKPVIWFFTSLKYEDQIRHLSARYGIDVRIKGYVAHDVLEAYLANADIFLNLGVDTDCMIPSKIFEYMSYGKMILSTVINEKDPGIPYLSKYPGYVQIKDGALKGSMPDDKTSIQRMLNDAKAFSFSISQLSEMFYDNSPKAYTDLIENLLR